MKSALGKSAWILFIPANEPLPMLPENGLDLKKIRKSKL
jgi:hypothetical protein